MKIQIVLIALLAVVIGGCTKENKTFTLKTIKLNNYLRANLPAQKVYLKVFDDANAAALAETELYASDLSLPATLNVHPSADMTLYKKGYHVELWGDSTGYIASCNIHMDDYKIVFPIDMDVKNDSLNVDIMGGWR
ncbi:hypothetical protein [Taibaiella soli]|uniref:Uncharacterized protein n=1 Tax=Taibaiella soli TaxID=1649169 RepID=A0A2W2AMJ1_9BACT|nr:hypothetical protein [Taibaiella soli]PZF74752.1 hypothetical protein DN068_00710 [Taibaiella soli]